MNSRKKILFISSNPIDVPRLNSDKEFNLIRNIIDNSSQKHTYYIYPILGATRENIITGFDETPWMVHYSGHGQIKTGKIVVQTEENKKFIIDNDDFLKLISNIHSLKCIFLNSCFSELLLENTQKIAEYSIGFLEDVGDEMALKFSERFYTNFVKCATIPHAFKKTLADLNLTKESKTKPVFKSKIFYVMNEIILKNNLTIKSELSGNLLKEVERLEKEVSSLSNERRDLFFAVLKDNPNAALIYWFGERKCELANELANRIFGNESEDDRAEFAFDLEMIFDYLETSLANEDYHNLKKERLQAIPSFDKQYYLKALDGLIKLVPSEYSEDYTDYLKDNIEYLKSLIQD